MECILLRFPTYVIVSSLAEIVKIEGSQIKMITTVGRQQTCLPRWRKELAARIKGDVLSRLDGALIFFKILHVTFPSKTTCVDRGSDCEVRQAKLVIQINLIGS